MYWIASIDQNENGSHNNQTWNDLNNIPEGYAVFSDELQPANKLENFPFGNIVVEDIPVLSDNGETSQVRKTITQWLPLPIPKVESADTPSSTELLKEAVAEVFNAV